MSSWLHSRIAVRVRWLFDEMPSTGQVGAQRVHDGRQVEIVLVIVVHPSFPPVAERQRLPEDRYPHVARGYRFRWPVGVRDLPVTSIGPPDGRVLRHPHARRERLVVADPPDPVRHQIVVTDQREVAERASDTLRVVLRPARPVLVFAVVAVVEPRDRSGDTHRPSSEQARRTHGHQQPHRDLAPLEPPKRRRVDVGCPGSHRPVDVRDDRHRSHDCRAEQLLRRLDERLVVEQRHRVVVDRLSIERPVRSEPGRHVLAHHLAVTGQCRHQRIRRVRLDHPPDRVTILEGRRDHDGCCDHPHPGTLPRTVDHVNGDPPSVPRRRVRRGRRAACASGPARCPNACR